MASGMHGLQPTRCSCPSPSPGACSNSCPLSHWCHQIILSSVIPLSSCLQSFLKSGSFPMSQRFTSGGQSIGASMSASVLPMNTQVWFPLELTGITLLSKELSRVFSSTTIWRHQFLGSVQLSSVTHLCLTLQFRRRRPPCPLPGLPVHHQLPEFTQTLRLSRVFSNTTVQKHQFFSI